MPLARFIPGTPVRYADRDYLIHKVLGVEALILLDEAYGTLRTVTPLAVEFIPVVQAAGLHPVAMPDLGSPEDAEWAEAVRRRDIIRTLAEKPGRTTGDVAAAAGLLGTGQRQVYNLIDLYGRTGGVATAFLRQGRGLARAGRLSEAVERIITDRIANHYLKRERPSLKSLVRDVRGHCLAVGLEPPSYKAVWTRVRRLDPAVVAARRHGPAAARKLKPLIGAFPQTSEPWEEVHIDSTPVDLMIVDETHRKPIGRPTGTFALDLFSRVIPGFALTLEPPSTLTSALCLAHAAQDKAEWLAQRCLDLDWPIWGIPRRLGFDRGGEYDGKGFLRGLQQYGIEVRERPPGAPHLHGAMERVIGTFMRLVHEFPGTTFSDVNERGEYQPEKSACLTLSEAERLMAMAICGIYHLEAHEGIAERPLERYLNFYAARHSGGGSVPARIIDRRRFMLDFLPFEERRLTNRGFEILGVAWFDDVLRPLMARGTGRGTPRYTLRFDPRDMSRIHVFDEVLGDYLTLAYRNRTNPPATHRELRLARERLSDLKRDLVTERRIFDTILLMRREIAAAALKTRSARKSQERRAVALSSAARDREIGTIPQVRDTSASGTGRDHPIPGFRRGEWIEDVSEDL